MKFTVRWSQVWSKGGCPHDSYQEWKSGNMGGPIRWVCGRCGAEQIGTFAVVSKDKEAAK